jgi:hypothetical protein
VLLGKTGVTWETQWSATTNVVSNSPSHGNVHCTNIVYLMLYVFTMNWTTPINVTDIYLMHAPKTWSFGSWIYIYLYNHLQWTLPLSHFLSLKHINFIF